MQATKTTVRCRRNPTRFGDGRVRASLLSDRARLFGQCLDLKKGYTAKTKVLPEGKGGMDLLSSRKHFLSEQRENVRFVQSRNVLFHGAEEARWERSGWR